MFFAQYAAIFSFTYFNRLFPYLSLSGFSIQRGKDYALAQAPSSLEFPFSRSVPKKRPVKRSVGSAQGFLNCLHMGGRRVGRVYECTGEGIEGLTG
jgi:hypothetical protein